MPLLVLVLNILCTNTRQFISIRHVGLLAELNANQAKGSRWKRNKRKGKKKSGSSLGKGEECESCAQISIIVWSVGFFVVRAKGAVSSYLRIPSVCK